jgi:hypothetical protein
MKVAEAKAMALTLMRRELDAASPDPNDDGKFLLDGRTARVIHHFSGWHPPIRREWFDGGFQRPRINGGEFHWYVFAIPRLNRRSYDHYFVCDYLQLRQWTLEFRAPKGDDHRDHVDWRADLRVNESRGDGYFRWGDEPVNFVGSLTRSFPLDNVAELPGLRRFPNLAVGGNRGSGESEAHRLLKHYVARNPRILDLSAVAESELEHEFRTGDRVDVFFRNHHPERSVVEVEVEGSSNVLTGVHQAIKYRSLAEAADGYALQSPRVRAYVVAYETAYDEVREAASRYDVRLLSVDRSDVLLGSA